MIISFYPKSMVPEDSQLMPLLDVLAGIRNGFWATQVQAIRSLDPKAQAKLYSDAKKALPGYTVSGTFHHRKKEGLLQHSGFLCLDIDAKDNTEIELAEARRLVQADASTYACFTSVGGLGWASIVPISSTNHEDSFQALSAHYFATYGLKVDVSCRDISRLRFVSYDPELYLNEQATVFERVSPEPTKTPRTGNSVVAASTWRDSAKGDGYGQRALERACDRIRTAPDGQKHTILNKYAFLCGGYVASGFLREVEAQRKLESAISCREVSNLEAAFKTIRDGIRDGQNKPTLPHDLELIARKQIRSGLAITNVAATIAATQGLPAEIIASAVQSITEEHYQEVPILTFWEMVRASIKPDAPAKPVLRLHLFRQFLISHGFRKLAVGQKVRIVRQVEQVVYDISRSQLKDFVLDYISELPFEFDGTFRDHIEELVHTQHRMLFDEGTIEFLPFLSGSFQRDTDSQAYFFYRNTVVLATENGHKQVPYSELPGLVWSEQLLNREFSILSQDEVEAGEFFRFLNNLANHQPERLRALLLFLGYYLHSYKDPSNPKIGVLLDESIGLDERANGGTGKSLLFKALGHLVKVVEVDGKGYDPRNAKALQLVTDATRVIFFNDWDTQRVPFDRLFNMATDALIVERLYLGQQSYEFAVSPKIGITTNGVLTGQGSSHDRRRFEIEVAPYYGSHRQPRDEFGHNFFSGWSAAEWVRFDALMIHACCLFLGTGGRLLAPVSMGLEQRRLRAATSAGFVEFMDAQPRGQKLYRNILLGEFRTVEGYDEKGFTPKRFGIWLAHYKQYGTDFQSGQEGEGANRGQRWIMLAQPMSKRL
jgi:hypothetical protein